MRRIAVEGGRERGTARQEHECGEAQRERPQGGAGALGEEDTMSKGLNVLGLLLNLAGVVVLFLFGMPLRVPPGGKVVTWTMASIDLQVKKLDDVSGVLGWIGLSAIVLGTLLQVWATLERR